MPEKAQCNARIENALKRNINIDAARTGVTIDNIVEAIIDKFFLDNPKLKTRTEIYKQHVA